MSAHLGDEEILNSFKKGGMHADRAFRLIVSKYGELLYAQIRRITRNHEHTNDVLQNVFIKVFQNLPKFKGDSALYTWMYRIARNETLNFLDKEKRRSGVDMDEPMLEIISGHQTLDHFTGEEITELLQKAIDQLPEKQALVFQLKYFEDLKYSEISKKTNTSEGALKASFHLAKQKIEAFLVDQLNLF